MKTIALLAGALAATLAFAAPAAPQAPFTVRTVTMNDTQGLAYYSIVAKRYRFVSRLAAPVRQAEVSASQGG